MPAATETRKVTKVTLGGIIKNFTTGTKFTLIEAPYFEPGETRHREVRSVRYNSVVFYAPEYEDNESLLEWPRASEVTVEMPDENTFRIVYPGGKALTYRRES